MSDAIVMQNVWKAYPNGVMALNGIDLSVKQGEFVYIVGPSGAGKSTFIKMIFRELKPTRGKIFVNSKNIANLRERQVPYLRRKIGIVFQDFRLLPKLTVYENVAFALEVIEEHPRQIKKRVMDVLDLVGLKHKLRSFPNQLSGGEQQRVSIARSIVNRPPVLIADEPTGNLDPETSWQIMDVFKRINDQGTTIIMATHNRDIVNKVRHRVLALEGGMIVRDQQEGDYGYED
ncbi:cell division ATP-binding protein FtsE [Sporolactobacillus terrae]|uniref:Cell division ATP-binding protein FtsE n=1 Tax=Sporolactobacillus terrae TaxID=269673 RepID=A0A410D7B9_9BACL|nr:cell division ATP-binding protein FtsE [Sporolactobacillus terrae]QAA21975.1 cell division ATP-binding protein FtsE [Sporolactobacillus terrae]QAA24948.1 cell division ATP-binding protein FtsE [Sporolactobacillus terrae]UAK16771.1 cell division ATP-binding protein FtsE [Sporolactobacillus terrae]BBN98252.1 cell division ATP-binding protein FtsE [Sporolactobacillus terrae]